MNVGLTERHGLGDEMVCVFSRKVPEPLDFSTQFKKCLEFLKTHSSTIRDAERLNLYVTGLTPLLTSFLQAWAYQPTRGLNRLDNVSLVLMHYDKENDDWVSQGWES